MPFRKIGPDQYVSPAGNKFNTKQIRLYYANGGRFPGQGMRESFPQQNSGGLNNPLPRGPAPSGLGQVPRRPRGFPNF
jgi:hypothetical protein